ncbi:hypothetical protein BXY66_1795 [Shimia isoporae]|uniref:Uncharacterized protein n=1 Tax=Shimia isoporae TaxID=647720 RepID=A0A4R1NWT2_9RHOB|nr:hypothetical protein [Shimia isoporae]TCL09738.1 hypothetical protein BXY66_1795 [Shimia isoporae]
MLGVVLWHDKKRNRAVIWCEDHGKLAYFNGNEALQGCDSNTLGEGDLVRFDVSEERTLRYARNPTTVQRGVGYGLPAIVRASGVQNGDRHQTAKSPKQRKPIRGATHQHSNVLNFRPRSDKLAVVE